MNDIEEREYRSGDNSSASKEDEGPDTSGDEWHSRTCVILSGGHI